ncbi:neurofilament heavy polypeptide isoform X2 [Stegastes partitus]|uniref:Neurofilament heavy polypeptide isoform X2 n=1 Tax=Stegastes partitus TaxID=144197 RepID=A0A9Y4NEE5_9TELE|nr:PREDICTED: neurofilament heavy polypeptide-like isoform X2 [Stegastes partitus]
METKYPTLRRPKRKLCYLTNKENQYKDWPAPLSLADVDKMFDDMDSSSHDDLLPPSPLLQTFDTETNENDTEASPVQQKERSEEQVVEHQMGPEEVVHPATRSPSPQLDSDCDIPFKAHGPVKTSSPIEQNVCVKGVEEKQDDEKEEVVSAILFPCDDEGKKEDPEPDPLPTQKPEGNATEESDYNDLESPPSKVAFTKTSSQKKAETLCKERSVAKEKTPTKPQTPVLKGKRKLQRQENTEPPVVAVGPESEVAALEKTAETVHKQSVMDVSTRVGKDMTAFLQKVKDAGQSKPTCSRKSPVKAPTPPPEPEDDFLIMDDETPLWVTIPRKNATSKTHGLSRTSSTEKDSSTDKGKKDSPPETLQQPQELEKANDKLGSQTVNHRKKKKKIGKEKNNEEPEPGNDNGELASPQDLPADLMEQEEPNKKKQQLKKVPLKENDKAVDRPEDRGSGEIEKEKPSQKGKAKQKASKMKKTKSSNEGKQNTKTGRAKSLKGTREELQGSDDSKEMAQVDVVEEQSQEQNRTEPAETEDLGSPLDKKIAKSEADGKTKQHKQPVVSAESSSEDSQVLGKRKRRQTGQWWLNNPQTTEEAENQQPVLKKTKQSNKEPSRVVASPAKGKRVYKKRSLKQPALLSSPNTTKAKEKKVKQSKKRNAKGHNVDKKTTEEVFEAEQTEEQEQRELPDQDLDQEPSSPLVFSHRDHSLNSGGQLFQRVYHHTPDKKLSSTPAAPAFSKQPKELREAEPSKRRRKPPGSWWMVDDMAEDLESVSSQPQQLHPEQPKPRKDRKKQSKQSKSPGLGIPKNGNMAASPKPPGGAPVPPLNAMPLSTPKTVKRSLATFKDIFTSVAETPTVVSNRSARQKNKRNVRSHRAGGTSATEGSMSRNTDADVLNIDAGGGRRTQSSHNNDEPDNMFKPLRSGPSSMIELEEYEENDDMTLPSSRVQAMLSASDLCAPPLKPLMLQQKDKANLTEWFKSLWSTIAENSAEITPDQFDWYFYQDRVIGFQVDLHSRSICNGKILLGSHAKKPLWVDHSATTVFNLLTSSVNVTIDGSESHLSPGQSCMVECGHAYSIHNATAQPAMLYFTRILAESSV